MAFGYSRLAPSGGGQYILLGRPRKGIWAWFFERKVLGAIGLLGLAVLFAVGLGLHFIAASASAIILTTIIGLCLIGVVIGVVERYRWDRDRGNGGVDDFSFVPPYVPVSERPVFSPAIGSGGVGVEVEMTPQEEQSSDDKPDRDASAAQGGAGPGGTAGESESREAKKFR